MNRNPIGNLRDLWILADCLNEKALAAGFDGASDDTMNEMVATLAHRSYGLALLDDYESRLGLNMDDERAAYSDLFAANGGPQILAVEQEHRQ